MSISISDLKTEIRSITRRDNTTAFTDAELNALLLEACIEISQRLMCLKGDTSGTLAASGTTIAKPSDMVDSEDAIDAFYLDSNLEDPLTFEEWRAGFMTGYAYRDETIYISPSSTNTRDYNLYYRKLHAALSTNLEFIDQLKGAVKWLTMKKVYQRHEQFEQAIVAEREYERELLINTPAEPMVVRARQTRE